MNNKVYICQDKINSIEELRKNEITPGSVSCFWLSHTRHVPVPPMLPKERGNSQLTHYGTNGTRRTLMRSTATSPVDKQSFLQYF